jgi:hypothetical protein
MQHHSDSEINDTASKANKALRGKSKSQWPASFRIQWDESPENYHRSLDGIHTDTFSMTHPDVKRARALLSEIDGALHVGSKRTEVWGFNDGKAARVILRWSNGLQITPPFLRCVPGGIHIAGGNHRIAVCRGADEICIPFLYKESEEQDLVAKLPSMLIIY